MFFCRQEESEVMGNTLAKPPRGQNLKSPTQKLSQIPPNLLQKIPNICIE